MSQGFATPFLAGQQASTVTTYTSGSGTYTVPAGVQYLVVTMCGGGGGGGGCRVGKGAGGTGGTSTFGSWTAIGGNGAAATAGPNNPSGGATGGSGGASGAGTQIFRVAGAQGGSGIGITSIGMTSQGPGGGSILSGGNAWFQGTADVNGLPGMAQGGGGAGAAGSDNSAAGGGGGGEQVQFLITSPSSTYSYAVGAGGTAGAGSATGGAGGSGVIIINEYYSLLGITGTLNLPLAINQGGTGTSVAPSTFYVNTANTTVTALSVVKYSNVVSDSASAYSTTTGLYTIPTTGWYTVNANIKFTNYNYGVSAITQMNIYQNSTVIASTLTTPATYNSTSPALNAGTVYKFTVGDTVSVQGFGNLGGASTTLDNSVTNFLSINFLHS